MNMSLLKAFVVSIGLAVMLCLPACSSHIPPAITQPPESAPTIDQVRKDAPSYVSQKVRWGGSILQVENKQHASWLSIVAFNLNGQGRPESTGKSPGRFIAIVDEFLEPLLYTSDRQITVVGTLLTTESRKVGEFVYDYPVVKVEAYYLWPVISSPDMDYPPFWWYDPWYQPRYPRHIHH